MGTNPALRHCVIDQTPSPARGVVAVVLGHEPRTVVPELQAVARTRVHPASHARPAHGRAQPRGLQHLGQAVYLGRAWHYTLAQALPPSSSTIVIRGCANANLAYSHC